MPQMGEGMTIYIYILCVYIYIHYNYSGCFTLSHLQIRALAQQRACMLSSQLLVRDQVLLWDAKVRQPNPPSDWFSVA